MSFLELLAYGAVVAGIGITLGFAAGRERGIEVQKLRQQIIDKQRSIRVSECVQYKGDSDVIDFTKAN